jgi:hypothetical protein
VGIYKSNVKLVSRPQFGGVQQQQRGQRQEIRKTFDVHNIGRNIEFGKAGQ